MTQLNISSFSRKGSLQTLVRDLSVEWLELKVLKCWRDDWRVEIVDVDSASQGVGKDRMKAVGWGVMGMLGERVGQVWMVEASVTVREMLL